MAPAPLFRGADGVTDWIINQRFRERYLALIDTCKSISIAHVVKYAPLPLAFLNRTMLLHKLALALAPLNRAMSLR